MAFRSWVTRSPDWPGGRSPVRRDSSIRLLGEGLMAMLGADVSRSKGQRAAGSSGAAAHDPTRDLGGTTEQLARERASRSCEVRTGVTPGASFVVW